MMVQERERWFTRAGDISEQYFGGPVGSWATLVRALRDGNSSKPQSAYGVLTKYYAAKLWLTGINGHHF
jgi:hypothetical protein